MPALAQTPAANPAVSGPTGTTQDAALLVPVNAGSCIVVFTTTLWTTNVSGGEGVQTITDSRGNNYTQVNTITRVSGVNTIRTSCYRAIKALPGLTTVHMAFSNGNDQFPEIVACEVSGVDINNPIDQNAIASGNSTLASAGPVITAAGNEFALAYGDADNDATTAGVGWTAVTPTNGSGGLTPELAMLSRQAISASGASVTATTNVNSGTWTQTFVTLRGAGLLMAAGMDAHFWS